MGAKLLWVLAWHTRHTRATVMRARPVPCLAAPAHSVVRGAISVNRDQPEEQWEGGYSAKTLIPVCLWVDVGARARVRACAVGAVRVVQGASGLEDVGFGIKKLRITCVVEDDKVDAPLLLLCQRILRHAL